MTLSQKAEDWLGTRGIDRSLAEDRGLTSYAAKDGGEVISFPFLVNGEIANVKHRKLPKAFRQEPGGLQCFWNYDVLQDPSLDHHPLIITEGEMDALSAMKAGHQRVVSVPAGAPAQQAEGGRRYQFLKHAKNLPGIKEVILAVDGDGPGQALYNDLSRRLGRSRCKWVRYPDGCKDLNDVLLKHGESGVNSVLRDARWAEVSGLYSLDELPPYPKREQFSTGFPWLDKHYRIRMGDFAVLTSKPGDGKSTFLNDLTCRLAKAYDWTIAVASFEQHPRADHVRALTEWYCGCPWNLIMDHQFAEAERWISDHFAFIVPTEEELADLKWTLDICEAAVIRREAKVVVIDPWNEMDHDRPGDMSLTEYTGFAIKEFKRLARRLDVHVIVAAHPTKLAGDGKPSLYGISDSAHWANKADIGLTLHRPSVEGTTAELSVKKSRYYDQIGRPGTVQVRYNDIKRRFERAE